VINIDAMEAAARAATSGPWRWEFNAKSKNVHLVGGRPQYDLTVLDFARWGMSNATIRLRDPAHDGMQLMYKLLPRPHWLPVPEFCVEKYEPRAKLRGWRLNERGVRLFRDMGWTQTAATTGQPVPREG